MGSVAFVTLDQVFAIIIGPAGAAFILLAAALWLARDHIRRDRRIEDQAEKSASLAEVAVSGWREQTTASATSADATEQAARAITVIAEQLKERTLSRRR